MSAVVFLGPSLAVAAAAKVLDARFLPPAAQGDVYRAALGRPTLIGIVDGLFGTVPAIWHKEILWAMAQGIHVFGSASMGALRAAELAPFGMEPVGAIAEAFCTGRLDDDDEVAVAHADAAHGFRSLSVALVNIRATLDAALRQAVIGHATANALLAYAKAAYYPQRSYQALLAAGPALGLPEHELAALAAWLPTGAVDQKRLDALAMLALMRDRLVAGVAPKQIVYTLEQTIYWEQLRQSVAGAPETALSTEELLDEARLDGTMYRLARQGAYARLLADALATRGGPRPDEAQVALAVAAIRRARGLMDAASTTAWLDHNDLSAEQLVELARQHATLQAALELAAPLYSGAIVDQLRLDGAYPQLRERALRKRRALEQAGLISPRLDDLGLTAADLLRWHESRRGERLPPDVDAYARELGFRDEHAFFRALVREYCLELLHSQP